MKRYYVVPFHGGLKSDGPWRYRFEVWLNEMDAKGLEFVQDIGKGLCVFRRKAPKLAPSTPLLDDEPF